MNCPSASSCELISICLTAVVMMLSFCHISVLNTDVIRSDMTNVLSLLYAWMCL